MLRGEDRRVGEYCSGMLKRSKALEVESKGWGWVVYVVNKAEAREALSMTR